MPDGFRAILSSVAKVSDMFDACAAAVCTGGALFCEWRMLRSMESKMAYASPQFLDRAAA